MGKSPELVVSAIIEEESGKVLLAKSEKAGENFLFPGGRIEFGERIIDAAKREVLEETGLKVSAEDTGVFGEGMFEEERRHLIAILVSCKAKGIEPHLELSEGLHSPKWVPKAKILSENLEPITRKMIEELNSKHI